MPKTPIWQLRVLLYAAAPLITAAGLLVIGSPLAAGIGLFIGFLAHLALQHIRRTQEGTTDIEGTNQP